MRSRIVKAVLVVTAFAALSGCGLFRNKTDYSTSAEGRPLEIPPDLDQPSTSGALTIPTAGTPSAASTSAETSPGLDPSAPAASAEPPAQVVAGAESTLHVTDSVAGAWRRIGLALNRAGVGEIVGSDESAGTYTIKGVTQTTVKPDGNFVTRMFKRDQQAAAEATRVVRVVTDGDGSLVRIEDEQGQAASDELARRIIAALKQRLG